MKAWQILMAECVISFVVAAAYGAIYRDLIGELYYLAVGICACVGSLFFLKVNK